MFRNATFLGKNNKGHKMEVNQLLWWQESITEPREKN